MSLNADTLIDRSYLKSQITKWRLIAIGVIVISVILLTQKFSQGLAVSDYVARVTVQGVIMDDIRRDKLFKDLAENNRVKAVILWVDSPGGTVVGGEQLYLNVKRLAAVKPVVVVMRSMAASAGYMATLGATRIYAREGTITGSIGVIMQAAEFTEMAAKLGIEPITIKSGPSKAAPNPLEKLTPENRALMENVVRDFFHVFVRMVAESRKIPQEQVFALADGRVFTGNQALKAGLIDALGGEEDALAWLEAEKKIATGLEIEDREPEEENPGNLSQLFEQMAKSFTFFPQIRLDGLVSIWQPKSM